MHRIIKKSVTGLLAAVMLVGACLPVMAEEAKPTGTIGASAYMVASDAGTAFTQTSQYTSELNGPVGTINAGEDVVLIATVQNTTEANGTFRVESEMPAGMNVATVYDGGTTGDGKITWDVTVNAGQSTTVGYRGRADGTVLSLAPAFKLSVLDSETYVEKDNADVSISVRAGSVNSSVYTVASDAGDSFTQVNEFTSELTDTHGTISPESYLVYKTTAENPTDEEKVYRLVSNVPAGVDVKAIYDGGTQSGSAITWDVTIPANGTATVGYKAYTDGSRTRLAQSSVLSVKNGEEYVEADTDECVVNVQQVTAEMQVFETDADVASGMEKPVSGGLVDNGAYLIYEVSVTNSTDKNVTLDVTSPVPANSTFLTALDDGILDEGVVKWNGVTAAAGEKKILRYKVQANTASGLVATNAAVKATWTDGVITAVSNVVTNTASVGVKTVKGDTDIDGRAYNTAYAGNEPSNTVVTYTLEPVKEVFDFAGNNIDGEMVAVGNVLEYRITVKNVADSAKAFLVTDFVPEHTSFKQVLDADGKLLPDGETIEWLRVIPARSTSVFTYQVIAEDSKAVINNTAYVSVDGITVPTNEVTNKTLKIVVKKVVENAPDGQENLAYNFTAKFAKLDAGAVVSLIDAKKTEVSSATAAADGKAQFSFTMKHGDEFEIIGLKDGNKYQITEDHDDTQKYIASYTISGYQVVKPADTAKDDASNLSTQLETLYESRTGNNITTIQFRNSYPSPSGHLTIKKNIDMRHPAYGDTSFMFDIIGIDGNEHSYHVMLTPGTDLTAEKTIEVAAGKYEISERGTSRYSFASWSSENENVSVKSGSPQIAVAEIEAGDTAVEYDNELTHWEKLSHSTSVVNHVSKGEESETESP